MLFAMSEFKYSAFISYRHLDNREQGRQWATWLHTALEQYEVPSDLVGSAGTLGCPVPSSLYPVFRDEEELPASADLWKKIQDALDRSRILIVICSPRAVKSSYVDNEIRYFKELGRANSVLALIVDGEQNASDKGIAATECYPHRLRFGKIDASGCLNWDLRTEPFSADARMFSPDGQGWTNQAACSMALLASGLTKQIADGRAAAYQKQLETALLKIIAGTLGTSLGELTRRDKVRQLELARVRAIRLGGLAFVFFLLTILAISGGIYAWRKKQQEEVQRIAAEGLLNFMLYDMRDKLTPMRRTDLLQSITDGAISYFAKFPASDGSKDALRQRATLFALLGDIRFGQNQLQAAEANYKSALELRRILLRLNPGDSTNMHELWATLQQMGALAMRYKKSDTAARYFQEAADLAGHNQRDLATSLAALGGVAMVQGNTPLALQRKLSALANREALVAVDSDIENRRSLALSHNDLGSIYLSLGESATAEAHFLTSHKIREEISQNGIGTAEERRDLSVSMNKLGTLQQKGGDLVGAERVFSETLKIRIQLAREDPLGSQAQLDLAASFHKLGDIYNLQFRLKEALSSYDQALKIRKHIADAPQAAADAKRVLCFTLDSMGLVQTRLRHFVEAETLHSSSLNITRELSNASLGNTDALRNYAISLFRTSAARLVVGRTEEAFKLAEESTGISRNLVFTDPTNAENKIYYAEGLEALCDARMRGGDFSGAYNSASEALRIRQAPKSVSSIQAIAMCLVRKAEAACALRDTTSALSALHDGLELVVPPFNKSPEDPTKLHDLREFVIRSLAIIKPHEALHEAAAEFRALINSSDVKARKAGNSLFRQEGSPSE